MLPDESGDSTVAFLRAAVAYYAGLGVTIREVLTDNGGGLLSRAFAAACRDPGLIHHSARPCTPRTNGKAERFIQTARRESACVRACSRSRRRIAAQPRWPYGYTWHRPHASFAGHPPAYTLQLCRNNLSRVDAWSLM